MRLILSALALVIAAPAFGEGDLPIRVQTKSVDKKLAKSLKDFAREEAKTSNSLSVKKIVKWNFGGNSGEFLLVNTKNSGVTSCIIYIKDRGMYRSLGGNDNCTWKKTPKLISKDDFAWIEFSSSPQGRTSTPVAHNELTAHFDKARGGICMLGLPLIGYESLRCPNDEAPISK